LLTRPIRFNEGETAGPTLREFREVDAPLSHVTLQDE
jgi:hypothetical protein